MSSTSITDADPDSGDTPGRRVVFAIYTASIATAAVFGAILGFVLMGDTGPAMGSFGPVSFPLTPLNLAIFGTIMVGLMLTVGLLLVREASRRAA